MVFENKQGKEKHNESDWRKSETEVSEGKKLRSPSERDATSLTALKERKKDGKAEIIIWSSEYRSMADALELRGDEGRDKLR